MLGKDDDSDKYDVDNYASLDSQLGKYDVNFKGDRAHDKKSLSTKRKSEELAVAF